MRSPAAARRAAGPLGTGFTAAGSRIDRKLNRPEIAASRRLMVAGANPDARPLASEITLSCWPGRGSARHAARYRSSASVSTASRPMSSPASQRAKCSRSNA